MATYEETVKLISAIRDSGYELTDYRGCVSVTLSKDTLIQFVARVSIITKDATLWHNFDTIDLKLWKDHIVGVFSSHLYADIGYCTDCYQKFDDCLCDDMENCDDLEDKLEKLLDIG